MILLKFNKKVVFQIDILDYETSQKKVNHHDVHRPNSNPITGNTLKISGEAVVETENSKSSHEMNMEFQLPQDVELEALESSLSPEGLLVVEAPRNPAASPDAPKAIPINRE